MKVTGILNINKPAGITSYDVVDTIKKLFKGSKVGHTGTLDPIATGVLPILIGDATRLSDIIMSENKVYRVKMLLGVETNTYDITGKIVFAARVVQDEVYIRERIKRFIGVQDQMPPIFSAIKIDGKKAYEYARNGESVELKARQIEIYNIDNIAINLKDKEVSFDVYCTKGTYIRSLVNDIGRKLGCGATMMELERMQTGNFIIQESVELYQFLRLDREDMLKHIIPIEDYYRSEKKIILDRDDYTKYINGMLLTFEETDKLVRVYKTDGYSGIGEIKDNKLKRFIVENE